MKIEKNILVAFLLNFSFSVFELIGGFLTNSIAIISDAIHDFGDSLSIGLSYFLEKKSKKKPDDKYTYGYVRYSVLGAFITNTILIVGSSLIIYHAIGRIINPVSVNYDGMIIFALFGVAINFLAAYYTKDGHSLNQKAVNLHMLEDVLGWVTVLIGALVMKITNVLILDPILSILVALFILKNAICNFKTILDLFLEKTPNDVDIKKLKEHLLKIKGIYDVHHIHIWSIDGQNNYATMHVVTDRSSQKIKKLIRTEIRGHGISHVTIELEKKGEKCIDDQCRVEVKHGHHHH